MILEAQIAVTAGRRPNLTDRFLANPEVMLKWGRAVPLLANVTTGSRLARWLGEKTLGISKERKLPRFRGTSFARWFRSSASGSADES